MYVRARGTRRFFSRSPWHVPTADERPKIARSRATRRSRLPPCPSVPSTIYRSIDDRSFLPSRQNEKRNATRLFCRGEKRIDYTRVYVITLTFSRQFNQLHRGIVRSFRNGTGWFFLSTKTSAFSLVDHLSLSHAPLLSSGFANVGFFSRDTRSLSLSFISPDHASPCASPPRVFSSPLSTSRLEDLE